MDLLGFGFPICQRGSLLKQLSVGAEHLERQSACRGCKRLTTLDSSSCKVHGSELSFLSAIENKQIYVPTVTLCFLPVTVLDASRSDHDLPLYGPCAITDGAGGLLGERMGLEERAADSD